MIRADRDYRQLRLSNLNSDEFKHLRLLLYWPIYGMFFFFVEKVYRVDEYYSVYCPIDDVIPFCEIFLIPYLFWFVFLVGMHLYTLLYDIEAFKKMMYFIMITYSATIIIYLLFPTCQDLRPASFERDNLLTRFMASYYAFDTNTNVCPSIHVIGSLAVMFTSFHCKGFGRGLKIAFTVAAVLISVSTVFVKQHSILDLAAAIPICLIAYIVCFGFKAKGRRVKAELHIASD